VSAKKLGRALEVLVELLADDPVELLVPVDEEPVDEFEEVAELELPEELRDAAAVGTKVLFTTPKPMADASVPVPPIVIALVSFRLVMTNRPSLLSEAVTCALVGRSVLMAPIKSPTVSVPVDVYTVILVPELTVIVPFSRIPSVDSVVPIVSGTVPVPVAGELDALEELEAAEALEEPELVEEPAEPLDDGDVELPDEDCSTCCTSAEIWLLTRFNAV